MVVTQQDVDLLKAARARIASGWTQGSYAATFDGVPIKYVNDLTSRREKDIKCWCMLGAIHYGCGALDVTNPLSILRSVLSSHWKAGAYTAKDDSVPSYNDKEGRTQAEVLVMMDKAIEKAEQTIAKEVE